MRYPQIFIAVYKTIPWNSAISLTIPISNKTQGYQLLMNGVDPPKNKESPSVDRRGFPLT